jgi:hypothetical protein
MADEQILTVERCLARAEQNLFPRMTEVIEVVVENVDQLKNLSDLLTVAKRLVKDADEGRLAESRPEREAIKEKDAKWEPVIKRLKAAVIILEPAFIKGQRSLKKYNDDLLALQAADLENKRKAAEAAQIQVMQDNAAREAECKDTGEVFEPAPLPPTPQAEAPIAVAVTDKVRGNFTSTTVKTKFVFECIDEVLVPRPLWSVDLKKCEAQYSIDHKPIPGIRITEVDGTISRFSGR